jgi:8-oxo-dGTP pyrophosphatase MutT (NUDIX family)
MHRAPLLRLLAAHRARWPEDAGRVDAVVAFVRAHPDCFERACLPGHVTGSAWIVSADRGSVLLTHHRKLGRWLQVGGHADGDPDPLRVALREAEEESGLAALTVPPEAGGLPLDVDVHAIPPHGAEPAHLHHDVRFLLVATRGETIRASDESHEVRWVRRERLLDLVDGESVRRMHRRAERLLGGPPP